VFVCVCLSAYNSNGMCDRLQIFRVAPGHSRDYFRHKKLGVVGKGPENLCFLFPAESA